MSLEIVCDLRGLTSNYSYLLYIGDVSIGSLGSNVNNQAYVIHPQPSNNPKTTIFKMTPNNDIATYGMYSITALDNLFDFNTHIVLRVAEDGLTMDIFFNGDLCNTVVNTSTINLSNPMVTRIPEEISIGKHPTDSTKNLGYANGGGATISHCLLYTSPSPRDRG